ncbi:MAG: hypothetical protein IT270_10190, partial [Saprospiraceae bacterium]|nr:hypothetical protein [Saprospiraceae bacterium]
MLLPTKPDQKHFTMLCFSDFLKKWAPIVVIYFGFALPGIIAQCPPTNLVPNFSFESISSGCSFPGNGIINGAFNGGCVDDGWAAAHGTPSVCNNNATNGNIFACLGANNEAIFLPLPFANLMTQSCDVQNELTFSSRCIGESQSGTIEVYFTNGLLNTPTTNTGASPMNIPPGSQLIGTVNVSGLGWQSSTLLLPAMSSTNNQLLLVWITNVSNQSDVGLDEIEIHSYSSPLKPGIKCIGFNGTNYSLEGYLQNSIQGFNVANWTWRFGNGTTVQGQNATVANVVYPVTLCITDNCGLTSFVTINQAGQATDIFTNTILSADQEFLGDLIVHSGAQLTVTGTLGFQQGFGVIVERNARIVLTDGGVLTRGCNTPHWDGVNVLGNSNLTQPATNAPLLNPNQSGIVFMDDGQIEWALTGISTGGGYSSAFWGGVVDASNSRFVNNRKAVEFMQYTQSTNVSQFVNVEFWEMADQWGSAFNNTEGVSIWETNGIEFKHCTFRNFDRHG